MMAMKKKYKVNSDVGRINMVYNAIYPALDEGDIALLKTYVRIYILIHV